MANINLLLKQVSPTAMQVQNDNFKIIVDRPKAQGGGGEGLMGGQYLLAGIGGCFCSTLFAAAQSRDITIEGLNLVVNASLSDDLPKRFTNIELEVSYKECSHPEEFQKLLQIAEKGCISVNTMIQGIGFKVSNT